MPFLVIVRHGSKAWQPLGGEEAGGGKWLSNSARQKARRNVGDAGFVAGSGEMPVSLQALYRLCNKGFVEDSNSRFRFRRHQSRISHRGFQPGQKTTMLCDKFLWPGNSLQIQQSGVFQSPYDIDNLPLLRFHF